MASAKKQFNKETFAPRAMTHGEIKELRKSGLHPLYVADKTTATSEDFCDWVLEHIYPDTDFSQAPHMDCMRLSGETFRLTYGQEEEAKNS